MALRKKWRSGDRFLLRHIDPTFIVVEKKAGMLTHKTPTSKGPTLHDSLMQFFQNRRPNRVYPVHRLDRVVSGLLVYARDRKSQNNLIEQFKAHTVERSYLAAVQGLIREKSGTFDYELYVDSPSTNVHRATHPGAGVKRAITHWELLETFEKSRSSLLRVQLETGVRNQIRVHLSEGGFPLLGERKYANKASKQADHRIFLHAEALGFKSPRTGRPVKWTADLPPDLVVWKKKL